MALEQRNQLTVREVARACGRSEETVRRWIWSGKLAARKIGNQLFVRGRDVAALSRGRRERDRENGPSQHGRGLDDEKLPDWLESSKRLQERLFKKYGYFDVVAMVREDRESH